MKIIENPEKIALLASIAMSRHPEGKIMVRYPGGRYEEKAPKWADDGQPYLRSIWGSRRHFESVTVCNDGEGSLMVFDVEEFDRESLQMINDRMQGKKEKG